MSEFISSFTTGFEDIIAKTLPSVLKGADIINVYDGLVHYKYQGNQNNINKVIFFNNSFNVIKFFRGNQANFNNMVSVASSTRSSHIKDNGTFRIRFMRGNQFEKINKQLSQIAEATITKQTKLRLDRLNPSTEFWYVIRNEGYGFYGQLLKKRSSTEKNLNKGELRPEFAYLMCSCVKLSEESVIMEPFAGFGAIPIQIKERFSFHRLIINDIDTDKIKRLQRVFNSKDLRFCFSSNDALNQASIEDASIDLIITDPPWGYYEEINDIALFYRDMLQEFRRVIKEDGSIVILSARKNEFAEAVDKTDMFGIQKTINTLVNGKKASVYILKPKNKKKRE